MNGNNELHLCTAEMIVAMQEYMDKRMGHFAPRVHHITMQQDNYGGVTFVVRLTDKEPPQP